MRSLLWVSLMLFASAAGRAEAAASGPQSATTGVTAAVVTSGHGVVITAAGPLPAPRTGVLHSPDRIYLDLVGVSSRTTSTQGNGDVITSLRVAQHGLDPLVTRIVIDLRQPCRFTVNTSQRETGRIDVLLTPALPSPPSAVVTGGASSAAASGRGGSSSARRYATSIEAALAGATDLRDVLQSLDRRMRVSPERLQTAQDELGRLRESLRSLRLPAAGSSAQDLVKTALGFASSALSLAGASTAEVPGNASSAAAGALLMLDRARAELRTAS